MSSYVGESTRMSQEETIPAPQELPLTTEVNQPDPVNQPETETSAESKPYCSFFQSGHCRFGETCFNLHELDPDYTPPNPNKRSRKKTKSGGQQSEAKLCDKCEKRGRKLRTVMDVVHRIQWDERYNAEEFIVGYLDRFDGMVEERFSYFDWSDVTTVDDWETFCIPKHRVYYFKRGDEILWDRRNRVDLIFEKNQPKCSKCENLGRQGQG